MPSNKIAIVSKECVACGTCVKACPMGCQIVKKHIFPVQKGENLRFSADLQGRYNLCILRISPNRRNMTL
jgi:Fe-S-cluster-containing hydrogenase component 2